MIEPGLASESSAYCYSAFRLKEPTFKRTPGFEAMYAQFMLGFSPGDVSQCIHQRENQRNAGKTEQGLEKTESAA